MIVLAMMLAASCIVVSGVNITAGDLAKAVPGFTPANPGSLIAYAPTPGVRRVLHAAEINQFLAKMQSGGAASTSDICFERSVGPLSPDIALQAMRRELNPAAHLEITDMSQFLIPAGDVVFPLDSLGAPPIALWRGYVRYDGDKTFHIWAHVKVSVPATHLIALTNLRPGVPIKISQLAFQTVQEFPQKRRTPASTDGVAGSLPKRLIAANSPVWQDLIDPPLDITKGDQVTITINSGLARISFDAEAVNSGRRGDRVAIKNPDSGKLFWARLESPGRAEVDSHR